MASKRLAGAGARLIKGSSGVTSRDPLMQCLAPSLTRSLATEVQPRENAGSADLASILLPPNTPLSTMNFPLRRPPPPVPTVLATVHSFPTLEPLRFQEFPANHLYLPLRKDILHRAVIFEGDASRQGTASTKWRADVHGSNRKIRPQKGTGKARLGDKKSPMLRGGGVAFGPKPRDFSTKLPKKVYDLAWRTALSYRYRRGQLIIVEDGLDLDSDEPAWFARIMDGNKMGNADGRSLLITANERPNLWKAVEGAGRHGVAKTVDDVDVKNLLEMGRLIVEECALDYLLQEHSSDIEQRVASAVYQY